ncbi:MAG: dihydrofolate reductase family protein [Candidatus Limnocylindrales bacterium]
MIEFARIWKDKPKIVFSRTLERIEWNSRLVRDDAAEEVARLKTQPGFDMDIGGPTIASTFMRLGLIDEYRLFVHPVILGAGMPFFPAMDDRIRLNLLETRTFGSGVVYLRYATISRPGDPGARRRRLRVRTPLQSLDDATDPARWIELRDPLRVLGLGRLVLVVIAERMAWYGDHPERVR